MSIRNARFIVILIFSAIAAGILQGLPTAIDATTHVLFLR